MNWFRRRKASAKKGGKVAGGDRERFTRMPPRADRRRTTRGRGESRPRPDWSDPDRDFITRYGDPFDG